MIPQTATGRVALESTPAGGVRATLGATAAAARQLRQRCYPLLNHPPRINHAHQPRDDMRSGVRIQSLNVARCAIAHAFLNVERADLIAHRNATGVMPADG